MSQMKLSAEELRVMNDQQFLLTKKVVMQKVHGILGKVEQKLLPLMQQCSLPEKVLTKSGKISQGENYQDLPYLILDFPRQFGAQAIFAYRTMFWWGHYFSGTLHIGGDPLNPLRAHLLAKIKELRQRSDYFCVNELPWHYHFQPSNYRPFHELSPAYLQESLNQKSFIKISKKWPLESYLELPDLVEAHFLDIMALLGFQNSGG